MATATEELRETIAREERAVGIRSDLPLSAGLIRHRRRQLAAVALLVFFGLVVATLRSGVWGAGGGDPPIDPDWLRAAMITCAGGFLAFLVEKELQLRRLTLLDIAVRQANVAAARALLAAAALESDTAAFHATLDPDTVLKSVVGRAHRRIDAAEVSVRLLDRDGELPVVCRHVLAPARPVRVGAAAAAARVAVARRPMLLHGAGGAGTGAVMAAPLRCDGRTLGTLEALAAPGRLFGPADLAVFGALAERAAPALSHALHSLDAAPPARAE